MPPVYGPRNFGITRTVAVVIAGIGAFASVTCIAVAVLIWGVDEKSTPIILPLVGMLCMVIPNLVSALKSTEAADTASKARNLAEFTASQTAALHQTVLSQCGDMCSAKDCPLRVGT